MITDDDSSLIFKDRPAERNQLSALVVVEQQPQGDAVCTLPEETALIPLGIYIPIRH